MSTVQFWHIALLQPSSQPAILAESAPHQSLLANNGKVDINSAAVPHEHHQKELGNFGGRLKVASAASIHREDILVRVQIVWSAVLVAETRKYLDQMAVALHWPSGVDASCSGEAIAQLAVQLR